MYAAERQAILAARLHRDGRLVVGSAAEELGVSDETIRRDLSVLEREGVAQRVHGGAVSVRSLTGETGLAERTAIHQAQKSRIATAALDVLSPESASVAFDAGSTVERFVSMLPLDLTITALTHAVPIAARLLGIPGVDVHVIGGRVRGITGAAVGDTALRSYAQARVDVAFVGTNGISGSHGLSTHDPDEAAVKRALISCARQTVVLADASKLGAEPIFAFAELTDIDMLVTDRGASAESLAPIREAGIEVIRA